jgi:hypothetical protein
MMTLDVSDYLDIFKSRRDCCRELLELSRRQRPLIDGDDYQQLLEVLGRKQRLLGCLDEIHKQHPDLRKNWREQKHGIDSLVREDCDHILAETEALLADLLQEERDSTDQLSQRRDRTQRALQAISDGGRVHDAYRTSLAPATHRHLDLDQ